MIEISSKENSHFRRWSELDSSKGIRKHGEFFLMGEKLIQEYLKNPVYKVKAEIIHEDLRPLTANPTFQYEFGKVSLFKLSKSLFNEIDFMGTHFNLLILELPALPEFELQGFSAPKGFEVLTPLGDPSNLGALIRSAVAFGVDKVILSNEASNPFLPKAVKASAGALFSCNIVRSKNTLTELAAKSTHTWALDMNGTDIAKFHWPKNMRLLIGEEGRGLPEGVKLDKLSVPTGTVESLNATVAASIALYSWNQYTQKS